MRYNSDNGSEFLNEVVITYCREQHIEFTRSRPYRKNDQAWVEQKNGAVVRRLVGYRRLEGLVAAEALARLYAVSRLFVNLVQPSFKLKSKERVGSRVIKKYHTPETPYKRLLATGTLTRDWQTRLEEIASGLDPLQLLRAIRSFQQRLAVLAAGQPSSTPEQNPQLDAFLKSLATAWEQGEVRPTHRKPLKPPRHWRTRKDPFEEVWPTLQQWLEEEPDGNAKVLLERLQKEYPGRFADKLLRTLQRRIRTWRGAQARSLLMPTEDAVGAIDRRDSSSPPSSLASRKPELDTQTLTVVKRKKDDLSSTLKLVEERQGAGGWKGESLEGSLRESCAGNIRS